MHSRPLAVCRASAALEEDLGDGHEFKLKNAQCFSTLTGGEAGLIL